MSGRSASWSPTTCCWPRWILEMAHEHTRTRTTHHPARRPARRAAAALAAGFPDRLAAGYLRLAARLRQVHAADRPGIHGRPVLGADSELHPPAPRPAADPRGR